MIYTMYLQPVYILGACARVPVPPVTPSPT